MATLESLSCPICTNLIENNRECNNCGTLYCYECIKEWSGRNPSCPQCRKSIAIKDQNDSSSFSFNRFVERTINEMEVDCPNGCSQKKVKRGNLKDHLEKMCENIAKPCEMAKYGCLFISGGGVGVGGNGKLNDLQKHYEECPYYKVRHVFEKYQVEIVDLTSKLSTLEQRNAILGLDNEELKDKIRKLNLQLQKQPSSDNNNNNNSQQVPSFNYSSHGTAQNFNSRNSTQTTHQQNNNQSNRSNVNSQNNVPRHNPPPPNCNNSSSQQQQQYEFNHNNNTNQNNDHRRSSSKKNDCKQQ